MNWCLAVVSTIVAGALAIIHKLWTKTYSRPRLDLNTYWGPCKKEDAVKDESIRHFQIEYPTEQIDEIKRKLAEKYVFTAPMEDARDHEYGLDSNRLQEYIQYWRDEYMPKWDERLKMFNAFPHFKTNIQGLDMHFIHVKPTTSNSRGKTVVPVLLLSGWPGSVVEFFRLIPMLMQPNDQLDVAFEIIAPSLPGFGWSAGTNKKDFTPIQMSIVIHNLMLRLGHRKYFIQSGDWGSIIGSHMATLFPQSVLGYHTTMAVFLTIKSTIKWLIASCAPSMFVPKKHQNFHFPLSQRLKFYYREMGYFAMNVTKPDAIGCALASSPVGLAAYILNIMDRFTKTIPMDAQLDNLMVYCLNHVFTTATRTYRMYLSAGEIQHNMNHVPIDVPTGVCRFPEDFVLFDWQLRDKYTNLIQSTYYSFGSHFAPFEVPQAVYDDFVGFVRKVRTLQK